MINWTQEQDVVFDAYEETFNNITIQATAGSGKTTVLKELCKRKPPRRKSVFLAFNKSIATELEKHIPKDIPAKTIHAIGLAALKRFYGFKKIIVQTDKYYKLILPLVKAHPELFKPSKIGRDTFILKDLLNYYRLFLCIDTNELEARLAELKFDYTPEHIQFLPEVIEHIEDYNNRKWKKSGKLEVDFTDMVYMVAVNENITVDQYDEVFVDEAQDASPLMQMLIFKLKKDSGRFIVVGDPHQAIYSFLGSDPKAFRQFTEYPDTTNLRLTQTFRCGKAIVESAKEYFPDMVAHECTGEGYVGVGSIDEASPGDFILCRNNKPLFDAYIYLLLEGKKAVIKDKDLGKKLLNTVKKYKASTLYNLFKNLHIRLNEIQEELAQRNVQTPTNHPKYINFDDQIEIIQKIASQVGDTNALIKFMGEIFDERGEKIQLMTMHKSKGLESDTVFIIRQDLMFGNRVITDTQQIQEKNLMFVARTRAKYELIFDNSFKE